MKHILNNLSEEEKNSIREQHTGGMKVMTENFSKLLNSKLGDSKPLVNEQSMTAQPDCEIISVLNELGFEKKNCNKSSRGNHGDVEKGWEYCNKERPDVDILVSYPKPYNSIMIVDMKNLKKEEIDNVTPYEVEATLKRMFPADIGMN